VPNAAYELTEYYLGCEEDYEVISGWGGHSLIPLEFSGNVYTIESDGSA
jgi:hypothetical protein